MDQHGNGHPTDTRLGSSAFMPHSFKPYQSNKNPASSLSKSVVLVQSPQSTDLPATSERIWHHQQNEQLQSFWASQYKEIEQVNDFKNNSLPLARIKKIMKEDENVRLISVEAPIIFARASEMFIQELTMRAWNHTKEKKRKTLMKHDIKTAITTNDTFDFLIDIVPREDLKNELFASTLPVGGACGSSSLPPTTVPSADVATSPAATRG